MQELGQTVVFNTREVNETDGDGKCMNMRTYEAKIRFERDREREKGREREG